MILETSIEEYLLWLPKALLHFGVMAAIVSLVALVVGYLVAAVRHGPLAAGDMTYRILATAAADLIRTSPRRILAIAGLAIKEAIRRRVWVVFVLFALVLVFAGWFLDPNSQDPAELYLDFVLWWTNLLIIFLAIFLSTFSLPNEIKNRIIYTVVTKPVRAGEIVLGRMLGFGAICTGILAIMGVLSYFFVTRSLRHEHEIVAADIEPNGQGRTTTGQDHEHEFRIPAGEQGEQGEAAEAEYWTEFASGHRHPIFAEDVDGQRVYRVGPREDLEVARVPVLARVWFEDGAENRDFYMIEKDGQPNRERKAGVSVGQEWGYRRFIEGNTPMAAVWIFRNINEDRFADGGILIERTLRVFRTHKGVIDKGITGNMFLRNPKTQLQTAPLPFTAKDAIVDSVWVDRRIESEGKDGNRRTVDLFDDLVSDEGDLEVWIQCLDPAQYFGVALPDLYVRSDDKPFVWNFFKGYAGIWFQMVLMVSFGVMFSTFLSGPVAMLTTVGVLILGIFAASFIAPLTQSVIESNIKIMAGGGPIESAIRLVTQQGIMAELEDTAGVRAAKMADRALMYGMSGMASLMPDLSRFDDARFVSQGYDVPRDLLFQQATITAGFVLATFLAGFLFLRMREVAK
jgi:ABC-type transport system involved in multi-copper enzyme maturation permease subunit